MPISYTKQGIIDHHKAFIFYMKAFLLQKQQSK